MNDREIGEGKREWKWKKTEEKRWKVIPFHQKILKIPIIPLIRHTPWIQDELSFCCSLNGLDIQTSQLYHVSPFLCNMRACTKMQNLCTSLSLLTVNHY